MNKVKELFLNAILVILIIMVLILVVLNWSYNLKVDKIPESNVLYGLVNKLFTAENEILAESDEYNGTPNKVFIKHLDETHGILYNTNEIAPIYEALKDTLNKAFSDFNIGIIKSAEFETALARENIVFLEFMMPLAGMFDVDEDLFVSNILIDLDTSEIYIKSELDYLKLENQGTFPEINIDNYNNLYEFSGEYTKVGNSFNLVSIEPISLPILETSYNTLSDSEKISIISEFLYNPNIVEHYETVENEKNTYVYTNEFSTITMTDEFLEFSSRDSRGDVFSSDRNASKNEKITFAISIFDNIQKYIGSNLYAYPTDIFESNGNTYVVLGAKINGYDYYYEKYAGYFVFSNTGVNYAEIKMDNVRATEKQVLLEPSKFIIVTSPENANLEILYREDKPGWVFKVN